jgi:hypothetical protein
MAACTLQVVRVQPPGAWLVPNRIAGLFGPAGTQLELRETRGTHTVAQAVGVPHRSRHAKPHPRRVHLSLDEQLWLAASLNRYLRGALRLEVTVENDPEAESAVDVV